MKMCRFTLWVFFVVLVLGCDKHITEPDLSVQNLNDFEAAWNRINDVYPFFEFKNIDWDSIYSEYRPRVETAKGVEFYSVFHDLLAELKDAHVFYRLLYGNAIVPYYTRRQIRDQDSFSLSLVKTYFATALLTTQQGTAEYGILANNIGYIFLSNLGNNDLTSEFPMIIEYMINTKGLILDLRQNNGGSIENIEVVVTRFLTSTLPWPGYYFLGELYYQDPLQPQGPLTYTNPVVVLINGTVLSAGETTAEILEQLPNVTAIGDTTAGGGGAASNHSVETSEHYDLPSGIMTNIPTGHGLRYDGQHIEWLGIPPDIRVQQTQDDIQAGTDKQLERAIEFLN